MSSKMTPKQKAGVKALLECRTVTKAAESAGVTIRTLSRWQNDPVFQNALKNAENESLEKVSRRLVTLSSLALDTLEKLAKNARQESNRRLAATAILDFLVKFRTFYDFDERLTKLENAGAYNDN